MESCTLGTERGVGEMYKILNDMVARHRQGRTIIKVNSTSKAWLKLAFKLQVNAETAHVAMYKCVSRNLLRILMMMEAEQQ